MEQFFLLLAVTLVIFKGVHGSRQWDEYEIAVGSTLQATFRWEHSLSAALNYQARLRGLRGSDEKRILLDCTSYNAGTEIGKNLIAFYL